MHLQENVQQPMTGCDRDLGAHVAECGHGIPASAIGLIQSAPQFRHNLNGWLSEVTVFHVL